ncbi:MAG: hypothetical protein JW751_12535 [Polyangiaceae bacterium]|nr:hypothetical protein [Polyangiaceae bacterium]
MSGGDLASEMGWRGRVARRWALVRGSRDLRTIVRDARSHVLVLLLLAGGLYFYRLNALAFVTDEIYHGIIADAILHTGRPILPNGDLYLKGLLFSYLGAAFSIVAPSVEAGVRSVSAISVLATGVAIFALVGRLSGRRMATLATFAWLFHPWVVEFARWGRYYALTGLFLTLSVTLFLEHESSAKRHHLIGSLLCLAAATTLYPFSIWFGLVLALMASLAAVENQPRLRRPLLMSWAGLGLALVLTATTLLVVGRFLPESLAASLRKAVGAFTGTTGDHRGPSWQQFVSFSGFYLRFFATELNFVALSSLGLLGITLLKELSRRSRRHLALLLLLTLGSVGIVSFVHLQGSTPRYLFPILPLMIVATTVFWQYVVDGLLARRHDAAMGGAMVVTAAFFSMAGSFTIPFRTYGDPYPNRFFAPTPALERYPNYASPARRTQKRARPGDIVISNRYQYYYFYTGIQPDYSLKFKRSSGSGALAPYMSKTKELNSCAALEQVLTAPRAGAAWLALNLDPVTDQCLYRLSAKCKSKVVYQKSRDPSVQILRFRPCFDAKDNKKAKASSKAKVPPEIGAAPETEAPPEPEAPAEAEAGPETDAPPEADLEPSLHHDPVLEANFEADHAPEAEPSLAVEPAAEAEPEGEPE